MIHLTEAELVAHAYADGEDQDATGAHLAQCPECSRNYSSLRSDLAEMKFPEPPPRGSTYGDQVWASISGRLPAYEARDEKQLRGRWLQSGWLRGRRLQGFGYAAACAGLAVCAFIGGRMWEHKQAPSVVANRSQQSRPAMAQSPQPVVVVILSDHLDRSEQLLVELKHADPNSPKTVSPLRDEARSLLAANGLCREEATQDNDPALATALDRLGHLLADLADQPGAVNSANITRLQKEMNADGLLFEVRVLRSRQETSTEPAKGGKI